MRADLTVGHYAFRVADEDFVNPEEFASYAYDRKKPSVFLFHDHGAVLAVVVADDLQDALDIAADEDKLDRFQVQGEELKDYEDEEGLSFLGNAGEPFDIESLGVEQLPFPPFSPVALYVAAGKAALKA
jgi:hypothetical protein